MTGEVVAVHVGEGHTFSKATVASVELQEGMGVAGDAHSGATVQHRSRVSADPSQPNLRQVHLIHVELLTDLADAGFVVAPGELGENITTRGLDLLALPVGTRLTIGRAVITVTGLRNPCRQIDEFRRGLLKHVVSTGSNGRAIRRAGVMGSVSRDGWVSAGDRIEVQLPSGPHLPLSRV